MDVRKDPLGKRSIRINYLHGFVIKNKFMSPKKSFRDITDRFETKFWADWKEYRHMAANNIVLKNHSSSVILFLKNHFKRLNMK